MNRDLAVSAWSLGLIVLGLSCVTSGGAAEGAPGAEPLVLFATIRGTINPASSNYLDTSIHRAEAMRAQALIVELDTPGGLVSSVQEMAQSVDRSHVPVVLYVGPAGASATSAGALLALASHVVVMAPGAHLGAAHPVDSGGKAIEGKVGEKAENDVAAFARGLAEVRGRNLELAEAIVRKSQSFTAQQALENHLADFLASDRAELLQKLDGRSVTLAQGVKWTIHSKGAAVIENEMSWGQKLLHLLAHPNIATLLISIGVVLIYAEVQSPGVGIAGTLGGICLLVAFMSFQMLPIRTGGLVLLFLGIAMFIAEPFVVAHGAVAASGLISFVLGILWVMDPAQSGLAISPGVWVPIVFLMAAFVGMITWFAATSHRLVAQAVESMGGRGQSGLEGYQATIEVIDVSGLRGKAMIRGETWDFVSSTKVARGDRVAIERTEGMLIYVKPLSAADPEKEI